MAHAIDFESVRRRLAAGEGGYETVHTSPGLELGVYVLVAPEPDRQQPHADDEVYVVLEGRGTLELEGETIELEQGRAVFVPAGADHRFVGYEQLSVLVIFAQPSLSSGLLSAYEHEALGREALQHTDAGG